MAENNKGMMTSGATALRKALLVRENALPALNLCHHIVR